MKEDLSKYTDDANELLENYLAVDLVSAFLKNLSKDSSNVEVKISSEKPLPYKGNGRGSRGRYSHSRNSRGGYRGDRNRSRGNYRGGHSRRSGNGRNFIIKNKKG